MQGGNSFCLTVGTVVDRFTALRHMQQAAELATQIHGYMQVSGGQVLGHAVLNHRFPATPAQRWLRRPAPQQAQHAAKRRQPPPPVPWRRRRRQGLVQQQQHPRGAVAGQHLAQEGLAGRGVGRAVGSYAQLQKAPHCQLQERTKSYVKVMQLYSIMQLWCAPWLVASKWHVEPFCITVHTAALHPVCFYCPKRRALSYNTHLLVKGWQQAL